MCVILKWPRHKRTTPNEWGLGGCVVCETWEGETPTDCPGRPMTDRERELVMDGVIDYRVKHGGWTNFTRAMELKLRGQYE